eukprot:1007172-Rhodomonas_salina.3
MGRREGGRRRKGGRGRGRGRGRRRRARESQKECTLSFLKPGRHVDGEKRKALNSRPKIKDLRLTRKRGGWYGDLELLAPLRKWRPLVTCALLCCASAGARACATAKSTTCEEAEGGREGASERARERARGRERERERESARARVRVTLTPLALPLPPLAARCSSPPLLPQVFVPASLFCPLSLLRLSSLSSVLSPFCPLSLLPSLPPLLPSALPPSPFPFPFSGSPALPDTVPPSRPSSLSPLLFPLSLSSSPSPSPLPPYRGLSLVIQLLSSLPS